MKKNKLKKGDLVKVITGKYKNTIDRISSLDVENNTVYLSSLKKEKNNQKKEIFFIPIHISNVSYWMEAENSTIKIRYKI